MSYNAVSLSKSGNIVFMGQINRGEAVNTATYTS